MVEPDVPIVRETQQCRGEQRSAEQVQSPVQVIAHPLVGRGPGVRLVREIDEPQRVRGLPGDPLRRNPIAFHQFQPKNVDLGLDPVHGRGEDVPVDRTGDVDALADVERGAGGVKELSGPDLPLPGQQRKFDPLMAVL